jgi:hypothetical protein
MMMMLYRLLTLFVWVVPVASWTPQPSRRQLLQSTIAVSGAIITGGQPAANAAVEELPEFIRPFTKLAPLGALKNPFASKKTTGLTLSELAVRLEHDLVYGSQNQGGYFLSGDLSQDIFRDDCVFIDPTNEVASLSRYQTALRILFDAKTSTVQMVDSLVVDEAARTISGRIRSRGFLQLPWHPYITAYESRIVYTVDDDGLVSRQDQNWSKSADEALRQTFTPTLFTPPPKSNLVQPDDEPAVVTKLFNQINGRRQNEYSPDERFEIAALIDEICGQTWDWKANELSGTWMLTYLQPGPNGGGIDRRIPFPEFDFNDSYQVFTENAILNIGQVFGPLVEVDVSGSLQEKDAEQVTTPKGFIANIDSGKLCFQENCLPLPIAGQGLFDGLYLGKRLRIGQNLNGSGARVVQVRMK